MADDKPGVKHIEAECSYVSPDGKTKCDARAFVQVIVVDDPKLQKSIDTRANAKLFNALIQAHREGEHDGR